VPTGPPPAIGSFNANVSSVTSGTPVTLSWNVTNSLYNIISPQVGPVRGTSGCRHPGPDDDLHPVFDEPVRTQHCFSNGYRSLDC